MQIPKANSKYANIVYTFFIDNIILKSILENLENQKDCEIAMSVDRYLTSYYKGKKMAGKMKFIFLSSLNTNRNFLQIEENEERNGITIYVPFPSVESAELLQSFRYKRKDLFYSLTKHHLEFI